MRLTPLAGGAASAKSSALLRPSTRPAYGVYVGS